MKVLNLRCGRGHGFEGWFASLEEFQGQQASGLVECPLCGDHDVTRLPSAPRLNLSGAREPRAQAAESAVADKPAAPPSAAAASLPPELQARWLQAVQQVLAHTDDVGEQFPEEARRIHYGEIERRGIRGQASEAERAALAEEGIEVMPLPLPAALKGRLQ